MKIFSDDVSIIEKELDYLAEEMYRRHNFTEKRCILYSIEAIALIYEPLGYDVNKYLQAAYKDKNFIAALNKENRMIKNKFSNSFINNKEDCLTLFDNILDDNLDYDFNYDINHRAPNLDENEMYEILNDFFKSVSKEKIPNIFKNLIKSKKILSVSLPDLPYKGMTFFDLMLKKENSTIYINKARENKSIKNMITLSHEMGHIVDFSYINNKKTKVYYPMKSPFTEVLSSLYEKEFIDFLVENNIYKSHSESCLGEFYEDMFIDMDESIIYRGIPDELLRNDKYKKIEKEKLIEEISKKYDVLVSTDEFPEPAELDIYEDLSYGYGKVLGTYFSRLKKEDKRKYQDEMSKFLNLRTGYFDKNYLEKMGTNTKKVVELVDRDINLSSAKVKTKRI